MKVDPHIFIFKTLARVSDPDPYPDRIRIQSDHWIRIRIRNLNTDPEMTHKCRKNSCFEVLDGLFCELQASSVTWTYFMEA